MSNTVKLSGKLAKDDEFNGLDAQADELIKDPETVRVAVVYYDRYDLHIKRDGTKVPTIQLRRFEPIGNVGDVSPELQRAIQRAVEERTGKAPLPFGQVEDFEVEE